MMKEDFEISCEVGTPMPYFAELPYYLWGQINYDSEGDCQRPTDRNWTWLYAQNRETQQTLSLRRSEETCHITSSTSALGRLATAFLLDRTKVEDGAQVTDEDRNHAAGMRRAMLVAEEFEQEALKPFDSHLFWGSWKWIGWFGTDFTWVGRWIMHGVVRHDPRAIQLCVYWLRDGTFNSQQSEALRYALATLTGKSFDQDAQWVAWYDAEGHVEYPEPDIDAWYLEMKEEYDPLLVVGAVD